MTTHAIFRMRPFTWVPVAILVAFVAVYVYACLMFSAPRYRGPPSDHFDGARFFNKVSVASS